MRQVTLAIAVVTYVLLTHWIGDGVFTFHALFALAGTVAALGAGVWIWRGLRPATKPRWALIALATVASYAAVLAVVLAVSAAIVPIDHATGVRGVLYFVFDVRGWFALVVPALAIAVYPLVARNIVKQTA